MSYLRLRLYSPTRSISTNKEGQLRVCIASEGYFFDMLSIEETEGTQYPKSAIVTFDEAIQATDARIIYSRTWKDSTEGKIYPGTVLLQLPLITSIDSYIQGNNFSERCLILVVHIEDTVDEKCAIRYIGPDDDGMYIWDSKISMDLPVSIHWLGQDQDTQPEHSETSKAKPLTWQAEVIETHNSAMKAQQVEIIEIRKVLHRIQSLLVIIGIGMFFYAIAVSI